MLTLMIKQEFGLMQSKNRLRFRSAVVFIIKPTVSFYQY